MPCPRCGEDDCPLGLFISDTFTDINQEVPEDYCINCGWPDEDIRDRKNMSNEHIAEAITLLCQMFQKELKTLVNHAKDSVPEDSKRIKREN